MKTLVDMVESTLITDPETRNSDIALTTKIWKKYYGHLIIDEKYIKLDDLFELPREDNIKRIRAVFQNVERRYLPTDERIFKERARLSKEWKQFLGYHNETEFNGKLHTYFANKVGVVSKPRDMGWLEKRKAEKKAAFEKIQTKLIE